LTKLSNFKNSQYVDKKGFFAKVKMGNKNIESIKNMKNAFFKK
jgi:hypothetical protein